jgi:hypothetical protein
MRLSAHWAYIILVTKRFANRGQEFEHQATREFLPKLGDCTKKRSTAIFTRYARRYCIQRLRAEPIKLRAMPWAIMPHTVASARHAGFEHPSAPPQSGLSRRYHLLALGGRALIRLGHLARPRIRTESWADTHSCADAHRTRATGLGKGPNHAPNPRRTSSSTPTAAASISAQPATLAKPE